MTTTLEIPSFERRLLQAVDEEMESKPVGGWSQESLRLCLDLLRSMREKCTKLRLSLEAVLADGVEAHSFVRKYSPLLPDADNYLATIRSLVQRVSPANDTTSESLAAELRPLEKEAQTFRDLLASALSKASEPLRPV